MLLSSPSLLLATDRYQAQSQGRHDNDPYRHRDEWKHDSQIPLEDWNRGDNVD